MTPRHAGWASSLPCTALIVFVVLLVTVQSAGASGVWLAPGGVDTGDRLVGAPAAVWRAPDALAFAWPSGSGTGRVLRQARRSPSSAPAPGPPLATGSGADAPVLGVAADGTTYAAWSTIDPKRFGAGQITVARLAADGSIGPSAVVSAEDDASSPALTVDAEGTLGVAWVASDEDELGKVRAAVGPFGGLAVRTISTEDANAADPAIAFDVTGVLRVAWSRLDDEGHGRIKLASLARSGEVSAATALSPPGADAGEPTLALDAEFGNALAWVQIDAQENGSVMLAVGFEGAVDVQPQTAPGGGDAGSPQLAVAPGGRLYMAWVRTDQQGHSSALVASVDAGVLSPAPVVVSGSDDVTVVRLAYAVTGDGVAVWRRSLDPNDPNVADVRFAGFDASGPQLLDVAIPTAAVAGSLASFSLRAVDVWSAVSDISWSFGDGATASGATVTHAYTDPVPDASVTVRATDAVGNASSAAGTIAVALGASGQSATLAVPPPLVLDGLSADFACLRYSGRRGRRGRAAFSFSLSEPGTVTVRLQRRLGSRPQRRCPRVRAKGPAGRYIDATTVTIPAAGGASRIEVGPDAEKLTASAASAGRMRPAWSRRAGVGRTRISLLQVVGNAALLPGTYVARLSALTADGRRSADAVVKFWVLSNQTMGAR